MPEGNRLYHSLLVARKRTLGEMGSSQSEAAGVRQDDRRDTWGGGSSIAQEEPNI